MAVPRIQSISAGLGLLLLGAVGWSFFTANPALTAYSLVVLVLLFFNLWLPGQPPVLFIAFSTQWTQASMRIFQANLAGLPVDDFAQSQYGDTSNWTALTALLALSFVIRLVMRRTPFPVERFHAYLDRVQLMRVFYLYLAALFLLPLLNPLKAGGLAQIIYAIQSFKWVIYCLLVFKVFRSNRGYLLFGGVFLFELLLGFTGFFSSFREVILFTLIAVLTFRFNITNKVVVRALPLVAGFVAMLIVWQGVKSEYRLFLAGGRDSQAVTVSRQEALGQLWALVRDFSWSDFENSIDATLNRIQYTEMLQFAMEYVPQSIPHENGRLFSAAALHVFTPRILFPQKKALNDSEVTSRYTGRLWTGADKGVSISMGYVAEAYVDFGHYGLYVPLLLLGLMIGIIYWMLLRHSSPYILLDAGAVIAILMGFHLFEMMANKVIGGILMNVIVYFVIVRPLLYPLVLKYILRK